MSFSPTDKTEIPSTDPGASSNSAPPVASPGSARVTAPGSFDLSASSTPVVVKTPHHDLASPQQVPHSTATQTKSVLGLLAALLAFLLKFKFIFAALKFGKILTTMSSMLLSIGAYALIWGWKFATGFVLLTFVHEMGHVFVAWRKKLPVSAPMFIPFLGAFITLKENPRDALTEAEIGYGGPLFGALGDSVVWAVGLWMHEPLLLAVASLSMMMNLFNLMPVGMLDGGRIVAAIDARLWVLGLVGMTLWFFKTHSPIMLIVTVLGAMRLFGNWKTMRTDEYFKVPMRSRMTMTALYVGLALYLAWGHSTTHTTVQDWMRSSGLGDVAGVQIN